MRVKICGITRLEDALNAVSAGADALGFIFEATSPRCLPDDTDLPDKIPPFIEKVAVFAHYREISLRGITRVQAIWGEPNLPLLRVIRLGAEDRGEIEARARSSATPILLDAHHPTQYGGSGETADWDFASYLVKLCDQPVVLAGGLTPENVEAAVQKVRPYGVDASSGLEISPGIKDSARVKFFIEAAKNA